VPQGAVDFYIEFFKKVRATPEWKKLMEDGAFNQSFMTGKEYVNWVADAEKLHRELMTDAGFLAKKK
jgi:tripartite-type tricarboxylate transporter receptor subunit TctC